MTQVKKVEKIAPQEQIQNLNKDLADAVTEAENELKKMLAAKEKEIKPNWFN